MEENLSTLTYASKASYISNKPIKNEDPKLRLIDELKHQVKLLTEELFKANQTIQFLSSIAGQNPELISKNLNDFDIQGDQDGPRKLQRQDSAETTKLGQVGEPV